FRYRKRRGRGGNGARGGRFFPPGPSHRRPAIGGPFRAHIRLAFRRATGYLPAFRAAGRWARARRPGAERIKRMATPAQVDSLGGAEAAAYFSPPAEGALDQAQELYRELIRTAYAELRRRAEGGEEGARRWLARFLDLGGLLGVRETGPGPAATWPNLAGMADALVRESLARRRVPAATYRLQLSRDFTFRDAGDLVPYLHDLGVSDCYVSPVLQARAGSGHGYDVCDHSRLNPELGGS